MRKRLLRFGLLISVGGLLGLWTPAKVQAQLSKSHQQKLFQMQMARQILLMHQMGHALPPPGRPGQPGPLGQPAPIMLPGNPAAALAQLGKKIFFDATLSNPPGMSCATCHAPAAGFTFPNPLVNAQLGTAPGIVPGRFGNRKVPTVSYVSFSPTGPTFNANFKVWVGGFFFDGRAATLAAQPLGPFFNPNEMNNLVNGVAAPNLIVQAIARGPYANQFRQVFGVNVFALPPQQVMSMVTSALAAWESSSEVAPFSSRYDAWRMGRALLSPSELNGLKLATGSTTGRPGGPPHKNAGCVQCHTIPGNPAAMPDLWTSFGYANTGVPRNLNNPYYKETNKVTNPLGYNPFGAAYLDLGLGDFLYPAQGLPIGNLGVGSNGQGDFLTINGAFKTPTLRNADKRPAPGFVKAYGHNGVFKSLPQVVHFYNTRNLTTKPGEVIDFTRPNPYAGLVGQPLWPPPEVVGPALVNPTGAAGQIGNLGLTAQEEADLVAFLGALSDQ